MSPAAEALPPPQQAAVPASDALEISLDLPSEGGLQLSDILFGGSQPKEEGTTSEEEWECVNTGLPVSAKKVLLPSCIISFASQLTFASQNGSVLLDSCQLH